MNASLALLSFLGHTNFTLNADRGARIRATIMDNIRIGNAIRPVTMSQGELRFGNEFDTMWF
jgi:hypothetical protein